mmetsp:Transcript_12404/g.15383  ORF Transcript_12404/g.15383 Transcript_12404/m.15383 type:complete len:328 (+) Transcript_12404:182-1165(+)|eukprot:CAMPEP_0204830394 /NCGR_PEP_ID=MMETSP1346-20131115/8512_1 /ASSEMBLY_ACC=CAM_ASM_000771 /TAXON_ID=215587 /ORGANISM="Aplanochytrium stocchinoi, Strain GSBS06" /LENGTH=327 /DNA_ID=CAMNT_0051960591 /DNA_START=188 /DNA_END=1171 /DNA_ORIENTATION=+
MGGETVAVDIEAQISDQYEPESDDEPAKVEISPDEAAENEKRLHRVLTQGDLAMKNKAQNYLSEESFCDKYFNKGNVSNIIALFMMILGLALYEGQDGRNGNAEVYSKYILSAGLFSFAGGITNWLAIKMLFDRVPFLIGSGVIAREFKGIRSSVKMAIMEMFFDSEFLEEYLGVRANELVHKLDIKGMVKTSLAHEKVYPILLEKLEEAKKGKKAYSAMLRMASKFSPRGMEGLVSASRPLMARVAADIIPVIVKNVNIADLVDIEIIETEIDKLMTEKLELLTPELTKELLERVIREHLGWLVVWGNVFGGLIGIVSQAAGYGIA